MKYKLSTHAYVISDFLLYLLYLLEMLFHTVRWYVENRRTFLEFNELSALNWKYLEVMQNLDRIKTPLQIIGENTDRLLYTIH
jgi:hypothetical protein